jgi:diacylglycerol O-acyltransferase / wax synthase
VSVGTGEETDRWINRVSMLLAVLPTDELGPLRRVRRLHESMSSSREIFSALPAQRLTDVNEFSPPAVFVRCG